jgi:hypothetical protein
MQFSYTCADEWDLPRTRGAKTDEARLKLLASLRGDRKGGTLAAKAARVARGLCRG